MSGTESNGRLPDSWCSIGFENAFEVISDEGKRIAQSDYLPVGALPVIDQGETFIGGYTNNMDAEYAGPLPLVIFGDHTRRVKYVERGFAVGAQGVKLLHPTACFAARYLAYLIPMLPLPNRGYSRHFQFLRKQQFPMPPRSEQDRIVAEIEKQFTRLDAAVAALKRVRANLKRYRAALLNAACEGRLLPTEAELARKEGRSYETGEQLLARILKERRAKWEAEQLAKMHAAGKPLKDDDRKKKYKEPIAPDCTALPSLPEGWIWVNLDQIICAGPQNGLYKAAAAYGAGTPILRIDDYQVDSCKSRANLRCLQTSADEDALYALEQGDIVLNRVNSPSHLGKCTVVSAALCPCVFESNMMRFCVSDLIDPEWVTIVLRTVDGKARLTANAKWAVNQASINQQDVRQTAVPLPPIAEQAQILAAVRQQLSINSKLCEELDATSRRADRLRRSILKRAFEGKLVPQDPNDEPASVLLERIRAEREYRQDPLSHRRSRRVPQRILPVEAE